MSTEQTTLKELRLRRFGKWFITPVYAVGSGMITTVAVSGLSFLAALALPWLIPILLVIFLTETLVNIYLFKNSVPDTLVDVFVNDIFSGLSFRQKILLGIGLFLALAAGMTLAGLAHTSALVAIGAIFTLLAIAAPPVAGMVIASILAVVAFFAFSSLLAKWISLAITNEFHKEIARFFKEIFKRDPEKPLAQQILENFFKLLFTFSIIAITIVGTIATLGTMQKGLVSFLAQIPNANLLACKISSSIIAYALTGVARLPWVLSSVCTVFANLGKSLGRMIFRAVAHVIGKPSLPIAGSSSEGKIKSPENNKMEILSSFVKIMAIIVHGVSFGALAKSGGGEVLNNVMNNLKFPDAIQGLGPELAYGCGSTMSVGIGGKALFFSTPDKAASTQQPTAKNSLTDENGVTEQLSPEPQNHKSELMTSG
jgi:hypothetical protein